MKYTIKSSVVNEYLGDNKINVNMRLALIDEYKKYQLDNIHNCKIIMSTAMNCRSARNFIKCAEQLEDEMNKQFILWKALQEAYNK